MSKRAMFEGADAIMDAFDRLRPDVPYYSVWQDRDMLYQFNSTDTDKGRDLLESTMRAAEENGNTDLFTIKFHANLDNGYVTNKSKVIGTHFVRPCSLTNNDNGEVSGFTRGNDLPNSVYHMLKTTNATVLDIHTQLSLADRLAKLEAGNDKEPDMLDRISGILDKPGVTDGLMAILKPFLDRLAPPAMPPVQQYNRQIAGVNDEPMENQVNQSDVEKTELTDDENDIIDNALDRLSVHCDIVKILPLLANMADNNTLMFKGMVAQLEKM